jgi:DNA-binding SARP family transcriptional activator/Tfp pilus assembly protein PilF
MRGYRVEFGLLGPLLVRDNGVERRILGAKQRTLLAVLLLRAGRIVPIDELTELVWDGRPPASARASLHNHVLALRRALGGGAGSRITTRAPGYLIEVAAGELDLQRFLDLRAEGHSVLATGDPLLAADLLARALAIWRGEPLADVSCDLLQQSEASQFVELRLQTVEWRIDAELRAGLPDQVVAGLPALCAAHPFRERFRAQLMLALYRTGRQADALSIYQQTRRVLSDELGVEPGLELQQLQRQILACDPQLATPTTGGRDAPASPRSRPVTPIPAQVPAAIDDFTGREKQSQELHMLLSAAAEPDRDGVVAVAAVAGSGGIGKSTLAIWAAHQAHEHFPDGQMYANMKGASSEPLDPFDLLGRLLRDLGVDARSVPLEAEERSSMYRSLLSSRRMLILLDDARDADQVKPLVPGRGRCCLLVTSRTRMTGLAGAHHIVLDAMTPDECHDLFCRIAGTDRVAAEPGAASAILAACAGLPLAIRIAASRLASRPNWTLRYFAGLLADERHRLDELQSGDLAVRASFQLSYAHLAPAGGADPARTFRLLGLLKGTEFGVWPAAALADEPVRDVGRSLEALVDAQLLETPAPGRYRLHDLLRVYAAELAGRTEPEADLADAVERVLGWYLHTMDAAAAILTPQRPRVDVTTVRPSPAPLSFADYDQAMNWCETERGNLIAAIRQAADLGFHDVCWKLAASIQHFFNTRKYWSDWISTHRIALLSAQQTPAPAGEGWILSKLGLAFLEVRNFGEAVACLNEALVIRTRIGDRSGQGATLGGLALACARQHQHDRAVTYYRQAIAIHRELGDAFNESLDLNNLADSLLHLSRLDEAATSVKQALLLSSRLGNRYVQSLALDTMGEICRMQGNHSAAIGYAGQALALCRAARDSHGEAVTLRNLADTQADAGQLSAARENWRRAQHIFEWLGDAQADEIAALLRG